MNRFEISTLRAYYGALITEKQNEWLRLHYDEDISLGEIAELYSVSRQAVLDGIKRGERSLVEFEEARLFSTERKRYWRNNGSLRESFGQDEPHLLKAPQ